MHEDYSRIHDVKASSNRGFGWMFAVVFTLIACWPLLYGAPTRWWSLAVAALLLALTVLAPVVFDVPNRLWQRLGLLLHRITSPVVMVFLFYGIVTPTGWLMRRFGNDNLHLKRKADEASYWIRRDPPGPKPDSMEHQF